MYRPIKKTNPLFRSLSSFSTYIFFLLTRATKKYLCKKKKRAWSTHTYLPYRSFIARWQVKEELHKNNKKKGYHEYFFLCFFWFQAFPHEIHAHVIKWMNGREKIWWILILNEKMIRHGTKNNRIRNMFIILVG